MHDSAAHVQPILPVACLGQRADRDVEHRIAARIVDQAHRGFAADRVEVDQAVPGELVICSDVPLADRLVKKGVAALDPRGREFDERNMGERLAVRNLFTELREQGQMGGGQGAYGEREKQAFANALDRILTRLQRQV